MEREAVDRPETETETETPAPAPALETLADAVAGADGSFDDRVTRLLATGRDRLGLSTAFYARIDGGVRTIRVALGDRPGLHEGAQVPVEASVCRHALGADHRAVAVDEAPAVGGADGDGDGDGDEPAGRSVVARLTVDGSVHGALCFAGAPAGRPTRTERAIVGLLAAWLGHELERRADAARLRRRTERLEEFSGVVAHDLRSPLNVATGQVRRARDALADDATVVRDGLDDAAAAHDRMDELIDELLALARQGETVGDAGPVELDAVARDAATIALPETAALRIDDAAGDRIVADAERLRTLLENLLRNAVEHGAAEPEPGRTVTVGTLDPRGDERGRTGIYVADDGVGIPPAERGRVFEEGYTTGADGTGYGLSIVSAIAEAHGWSVSIEAAGSGGARFEFRGVELAPDG
jgi:signal transduction histidine kinase